LLAAKHIFLSGRKSFFLERTSRRQRIAAAAAVGAILTTSLKKEHIHEEKGCLHVPLATPPANKCARPFFIKNDSASS